MILVPAAVPSIATPILTVFVGWAKPPTEMVSAPAPNARTNMRRIFKIPPMVKRLFGFDSRNPRGLAHALDRGRNERREFRRRTADWIQSELREPLAHGRVRHRRAHFAFELRLHVARNFGRREQAVPARVDLCRRHTRLGKRRHLR